MCVYIPTAVLFQAVWGKDLPSKADFSQRLMLTKAGLATSSARSSAAWLQFCQKCGFIGGNDPFLSGVEITAHTKKTYPRNTCWERVCCMLLHLLSSLVNMAGYHLTSFENSFCSESSWLWQAPNRIVSLHVPWNPHVLLVNISNFSVGSRLNSQSFARPTLYSLIVQEPVKGYGSDWIYPFISATDLSFCIFLGLATHWN